MRERRYRSVCGSITDPRTIDSLRQSARAVTGAPLRGRAVRAIEEGPVFGRRKRCERVARGAQLPDGFMVAEPEKVLRLHPEGLEIHPARIDSARTDYGQHVVGMHPKRRLHG